jgi:hypothetical protein
VELVRQGPRRGLDGATEGELGREPRRRRDRQQVQQHGYLAVGRGERSAGEPSEREIGDAPGDQRRRNSKHR